MIICSFLDPQFLWLFSDTLHHGDIKCVWLQQGKEFPLYECHSIFYHLFIYMNKMFSSVSAHGGKLKVTDKWFSFCSCVSSHGMTVAETHLISKSVVKIA
jgi:hypothetical protein